MNQTNDYKCKYADTRHEKSYIAVRYSYKQEKQVDITISKNQALQILYLVYLLFNSIYNDTVLQF